MRVSWTISAREHREIYLLERVWDNVQTLGSDAREATITPAMKNGELPQIVAAPFAAGVIGILGMPETLVKGVLGVSQTPLRLGETFTHQAVHTVSAGIRKTLFATLTLDPRGVIQGLGQTSGGAIGAVGAPIADTLAAPFNHSTAA